MMEPTFDFDGYPTDDTIRAIEQWPAEDLPGLFEFIKTAWRYPESFWVEGKARRMATGGWSGNESLIYALQRNFVAWALTWVMSRRGGCYEFEIP